MEFGGIRRVNVRGYGNRAWVGLWSGQTRWAEWPPSVLQGFYDSMYHSLVWLLLCPMFSLLGQSGPSGHRYELRGDRFKTEMRRNYFLQRLVNLPPIARWSLNR